MERSTAGRDRLVRERIRSYGARRGFFALISLVALLSGIAVKTAAPAAAVPLTTSFTWDSQSDFESNFSTTGETVALGGLTTTDPVGAVRLPDPHGATVAVSAGSLHTVGLRSDGIAVATGDNTYGQCNVSGWTNLAAVSAGTQHTVGLKGDGTAVATGDSLFGQCDVSSWTNLVAVSAGAYHTVGLKSDGNVVAVGSNPYGQCNVSGWTNLAAVSAGTQHTVGLKGDGTAVATGDNTSGQCNISGWTNLVAVSAGTNYTVGLKSDGTAVATGDNLYGRCNVSGWTNLVAVSAGTQHTVGLKRDGNAVAVGRSGEGQCNVSRWTNLAAVSAGTQHTVGLKGDGTAVATGDNTYGQCNVSGWTNLAAVSAGYHHTVGLKGDGTAVATGDNTYGQCNISGWESSATPRAGTIGGAGLVGLRAVHPVDAGPGSWRWSTLSADMASLVPSESVKIGIRVSDDGVTWSEPLGRDGLPVDWTDSSGSYFGSTCGDAWRGDLRNVPVKRYVDLEVRLSSGGVTSPILRSLTLQDQVNVATVENDAPGVTFGRFISAANSAYSGGGYAYTYGNGICSGTDIQARVSGTRIRWKGPKQPGYGKADVYLDGVYQGRVDCYAPAGSAVLSATLWESGTLVDATHTLRIVSVNDKNPSSSGYVIVVDCFEVVGSSAPGTGTRFNQSEGEFSGLWIHPSNVAYTGGNYSYSYWPPAYFRKTFYGTRVSWIGPKTVNYGYANVYIDGVMQGQVSQYDATTAWRRRVWESPVLARGNHTLVIRPTGTKPPGAVYPIVVIDGVEVAP